MTSINDMLDEIHDVSLKAVDICRNKDEGPLLNFLFILILRITKISRSLKVLYPIFLEDRTIEFSIGILLRSLLTDALLFLKFRTCFLDFKDEISKKELKEKLEKYVTDLYAEEINFLIKDIERSVTLTPEEKKQYFSEFIKPFNSYFKWSDDKFSFIKQGVNNAISDSYLISKKYAFGERESLYALYAKYSKYNHPGKFILAFESANTENLIEEVNASISIIRVHLFFVLGIIIDFSETSQGCLPLYNQLGKAYKIKFDEDSTLE